MDSACAVCATLFRSGKKRNGQARQFCSPECWRTSVRMDIIRQRGAMGYRPDGLCACGCGRPTKIATETDGHIGRVAGLPDRCIRGHAIRKRAPDATVHAAGAAIKTGLPLATSHAETLHRLFDGKWTIASNGCWEWSGARSRAGYGLIAAGIQLGAHRVSYALSHGFVDPELMVCHRCDNPCCVNPDHLFLGSGKDNMADASRKGRLPTGERHHNARLSDALVAEIRLAYQQGKHRGGHDEQISSVRWLSRKYGVSRSVIRRAIEKHPETGELQHVATETRIGVSEARR